MQINSLASYQLQRVFVCSGWLGVIVIMRNVDTDIPGGGTWQGACHKQQHTHIIMPHRLPEKANPSSSAYYYPLMVCGI